MTRFLKLTVLITAALMVLMACQSTGAKSDAPVAAGEIKAVKLMLPGADCISSGAAIQTLLDDIDGVSDVEIDIDEGSAILKYDTAKTSIGAMKSMLEAADFELTGSEEIK